MIPRSPEAMRRAVDRLTTRASIEDDLHELARAATTELLARQDYLHKSRRITRWLYAGWLLFALCAGSYYKVQLQGAQEAIKLLQGHVRKQEDLIQKGQDLNYTCTQWFFSENLLDTKRRICGTKLK